MLSCLVTYSRKSTWTFLHCIKQITSIIIPIANSYANFINPFMDLRKTHNNGTPKYLYLFLNTYSLNPKKKNDYSLFFKGRDIIFIYILVNIDDIIIIGLNHQFINSLKQSLHVEFQLKDLGDLKYFLSLEVGQSSDRITLI